MKKYSFQKEEKKWQKYWNAKKTYKTDDKNKKKKFYVLDMFPYPSGEGLHVGHVEGYTASDIISRYKRMNGFNVLHPMGWDAFGLPAENYAIKNKIHPKIAVDRNIKNFKRQMQSIGFDYDWSREINTTDEKYYKWTQWMFLQMFKKGLALESYEPIIWCPSCKTGLAQEDLEGDRCERCKSPVERKKLRQWVLKITDYADRLLADLDSLDWHEKIKAIQRNWIGRSEGAVIKFSITNFQFSIEVFTTRPDTIFGVSYIVLAPENKLVEELKVKIENWKEVEKYIKEAQRKTDLDRQENKEKTGVKLKGITAINPANGKEMPIWISDYVLAGYGTGAVMAVPAHDQRDFDFAKKFNLPITYVIELSLPAVEKGELIITNRAYEGGGVMISSGDFTGMESENARREIVDWLIKKGQAERTINYRLQDWVFSRQRYWGEPIPIIRCEECGNVPVPEKDLPVKLPKVKSYEPTGTGESPLAAIDKWVNVKCPKCKGKAKRETNTMPQWAGSCWYYFRFIDPKNNKAFADKKKEKYWMPVDLYIGGVEHAARHLIYARFWHKVLYDLKLVSGKEPFKKLVNQGLILGPDGQKMSKSKGNVINPDEVVKEYGADVLRMYEMFMGPLEDEKPWDIKGVVGIRRFLDRVWNLQDRIKNQSATAERIRDDKIEKLLHKTIKKVTEDIENFRFNTAISAMMILMNEMEKQEKLSVVSYELLVKLLSPFAPHLTEELWHLLQATSYKLQAVQSIHLEKWPKYNPKLAKDDVCRLIVQINGKTRGIYDVALGATEEEAKTLALKEKEISKWMEGKEIRKVIFLKDRLINFIV